MNASYPSAWDLARATPKGGIDRVRAAAYSKRFVVLWRSPLILAYLGDHGDYVLVDHHYCSCEGFTRRITRDGLGGCTHVFASRIALDEGWYRDVSQSMDPVLLSRIVWEALTGSIAFSLRRLLALTEDVGDGNDHGE
jgi:predicted nucleic acid-binding Zn finger protein